MIFTSGPLARSQTTTEIFLDHKIAGRAPAQISDVKVFGIRFNPIPVLLANIAVAWAFIGSILTGSAVSVSKSLNAIKDSASVYLFPRPPMVFTLKKVNETVETKLVALGFTKMSSNKYNYWKGPATDEAIRAVLPLGVYTDAYAPQNSASIDGIMTLSIMNRVLTGCLSFLKDVTAKATVPGATVTQTAVEFSITEATFDMLPEFGTYLPYFEGLLLPDSALTPSLFIGYFSTLLGTTPKEISEACALLISGWSSLSATTSGKALSHMMFCIDIALKNGFDMSPVFLNNEYSGCVFHGRSTLFLDGKQVVKAVNKEKLQEEMESFITHDSALARIAEILSGMTSNRLEKKVTVASSDISSPRALHYLIRDRDFDGPSQAALRSQVNKLRYRQTFWDASDPTKVRALVLAVTKKEWLPVEAPFNHKSVNLFTKDPILSALNAFGKRAPTLRGNGTQVTIKIASKCYEAVKRPGNIDGIPVFFKPVQDAFEDWEKIISDQTVMFSHKGKDKMGRMRISGLGTMLDFKENEIIISSIVSAASNRRKALNKDATKERQPAGDDDERRKRRKVRGYGMVGITYNDPGESMDTGEGGNADADDDFFADVV